MIATSKRINVIHVRNIRPTTVCTIYSIEINCCNVCIYKCLITDICDIFRDCYGFQWVSYESIRTNMYQ